MVERSQRMSKAFAQSGAPTRHPETVLSLEVEKNRIGQKGRDIAKKLLSDMERRLERQPSGNGPKKKSK
jgi:glycine cleavage system protein P-like pyridoxal-binding family